MTFIFLTSVISFDDNGYSLVKEFEIMLATMICGLVMMSTKFDVHLE